jgi:hypothetical protein
METERVIKEFPEYLSKCYFGFEAGWNELIFNLCTDLKLNGVPPFKSGCEAKEKYGTLRFGPYDGTTEEGWKIIEKYEDLSASVCEFCGKTGAKVRNERSWVKTLCDICNKGY